MILVDANLLVYAYMDGVPQHRAAKAWLEERFADTSEIGLPWAALLAFVRIASNRRIFERPSPILLCWQQVEEWLDLEPTWIPLPTPRHRAQVGDLLSQIGTDSNLVPDAHLAALAIEHDLTLCSADQGFRKFADLRWENPLDR